MRRLTAPLIMQVSDSRSNASAEEYLNGVCWELNNTNGDHLIAIAEEKSPVGVDNEDAVAVSWKMNIQTDNYEQETLQRRRH